jgi:hypothetical protein
MLNDGMNNEFKRIEKEAEVARFKAGLPSRHLPGRTEEKYDKPQSGQLVSGPRFEPEISQI